MHQIHFINSERSTRPIELLKLDKDEKLTVAGKPFQILITLSAKKSAASTSTMSFVQFVRMTPRFAYWAELKAITQI